MRTSSIAEQSTRYCNYSKKKFGGEVTFVIPSWLNFKEGTYTGKDCYDDFYTNDSVEYDFMIHLLTAEATYLKLIKDGWQPQQAREVLPLATATEVVYTAFEDDWEHFFDLRYRGTTGLPHPNAQQVASMAHDLIIKELGKDL
nr:MAG TPA: Thymidylate synthase complementing protein [Caudoviricetes sp.]